MEYGAAHHQGAAAERTAYQGDGQGEGGEGRCGPRPAQARPSGRRQAHPVPSGAGLFTGAEPPGLGAGAAAAEPHGRQLQRHGYGKGPTGRDGEEAEGDEQVPENRSVHHAGGPGAAGGYGVPDKQRPGGL